MGDALVYFTSFMINGYNGRSGARMKDDHY